MKGKSGISLLDVIILILVVGVIAALVIPMMREKDLVEAEKACRAKMELMNKAMVDFFSTSGDPALLNQPEKPVEPETTEVATPAPKGKGKEPPVEVKVRMFTDDMNLLKPYLPEGFDFKCPLDGQEYVVIVRDSVFYSISCKNGHGQVIKGEFTWEEK